MGPTSFGAFETRARFRLLQLGADLAFEIEDTTRGLNLLETGIGVASSPYLTARSDLVHLLKLLDRFLSVAQSQGGTLRRQQKVLSRQLLGIEDLTQELGLKKLTLSIDSPADALQVIQSYLQTELPDAT